MSLEFSEFTEEASQPELNSNENTSDLDFYLIDNQEGEASKQDVASQEEVSAISPASKEYSGRRLKLYGWLYPFFGIYYCIRHPILVGPALCLPVLKTGVTLAILYPIMNTGFQKQSSFLRGYLANTQYYKYSWFIIAGLWVFQKTWINFFVYDKVIKYFARGLLLKVYNVVSNNPDTISINTLALQEKSTDKSSLSYVRFKTTSLISAPEGEVPTIKPRPITKKFIDLFYASVGFLVPKSKWSISSFFWGRLLPTCFRALVPIGAGAIMYSVASGPTRANNLLHPFFKKSLPGGAPEKQAWLKDFSLSMRCLGVSAAFLETLPLAGPLFAFSNTVGAGIWLATYHPPIVSESTGSKSQ